MLADLQGDLMAALVTFKKKMCFSDVKWVPKGLENS